MKRSRALKQWWDRWSLFCNWYLLFWHHCNSHNECVMLNGIRTRISTTVPIGGASCLLPGRQSTYKLQPFTTGMGPNANNIPLTYLCGPQWFLKWKGSSLYCFAYSTSDLKTVWLFCFVLINKYVFVYFSLFKLLNTKYNLYMQMTRIFKLYLYSLFEKIIFIY